MAEIPISDIPMLLGNAFGMKQRKAPLTTPGMIQRSREKVMNSAVKVDPIFVPRIIPIVCGNVKLPAETRPTVMTITAELLCRIPVKMVPAKKPFHGLSVTFERKVFNAAPDILNSPIRKTDIPAKNIAMNKRNKNSSCMTVTS